LFGQPAAITGADGRSLRDVDLDRGTFFPIDGYSADRIEKIAVENFGDLRRTLLDELRAEELHQIQLRVADQRRSLEKNADAVRSTTREIFALTERIEELGGARARLAALPPSPDELSSMPLIKAAKQQEANKRENERLADVAATASEFRSDLRELVARHAKRLSSSILVPDSDNSTIIRKLESDLAEIDAAIAELANKIDEWLEAAVTLSNQTSNVLRAPHDSQNNAFVRLQEQNQAAGAAIQERTAAQRDVSLLESLELQRAEAREELTSLRELRKNIKGAYLLERDNISNVRTEVATELERQAGRKVRVRITRNADSLEYQQTLLEALRGARVKNHDEILRSLMRLRPEQLAQIIQDDDLQEFEQLVSLGAERCRKILDAFRENIDPLSLEITGIDDKVSIELNVGSDTDPNFKDAAQLSSGQKCTALLPLLMARRDTPLIIDQPEDNLDNHFIYETVVESIRRLKGRRQMIFVTHNANIPVLGEADLVVVLESDGTTGRVSKVGSLDVCKDEIIDLLEGGREAFELRRKRYGER
jgi:hypothetical protein